MLRSSAPPGSHERPDAVGLRARVVAKRPADGLAHEEVPLGGVGVDDTHEQVRIRPAAQPELSDDGSPPQPSIGLPGPGEELGCGVAVLALGRLPPDDHNRPPAPSPEAEGCAATAALVTARTDGTGTPSRGMSDVV